MFAPKRFIFSSLSFIPSLPLSSVSLSLSERRLELRFPVLEAFGLEMRTLDWRDKRGGDLSLDSGVRTAIGTVLFDFRERERNGGVVLVRVLRVRLDDSCLAATSSRVWRMIEIISSASEGA